MSRLSKLGYNLSPSSLPSSFSGFKHRRTLTVPCKSFVSDCSPIRSAGASSFAEVRRGTYLSTRSFRASATAPAPAPARSAPSLPAPSTRFVRAPVPARTGTGATLTRSLPSQSRGAAQQDGPLDVVHSIMERARLRSQALRSRYGLPERLRFDPRTQTRVEQSSTSLDPTTRPTRFAERIRILAEEAAASSANRRATLSKFAAFDEVVARVRARKQSTPSAPPLDATHPVTRANRVRPSVLPVNVARPVTRSDRVRPFASSIDTTRPITRPVPSSERVCPSASSVFDRISNLRIAQAERRRWIDEMIAEQKERALIHATTSAAIEQFRAKHQARLPNRSCEGHLTSRRPAPTNSTRNTAIPPADPVRTRRSNPPADRLRKDKPAKRVRFGDVTISDVSRPSLGMIEAGLTGIHRTFYAEMTNPARCAKGGAPPRRADAETNAEDCVRTRWLVVAQKYRVGGELLSISEFRFDFRGPRPIERVSRTAGGGWWLRVNGPVVRRKLDVGGIPTDTGVDKRRRALAMQASNTRFQIL
ncbi:hypothetical protein KXW87_008676 [Aspergillus fumigatus]|nr:hypothetical protein KXX11_000920 [Aspergillus fumigatus]KAH2334244.1 hypothetical protein KXW87_008676 [Aspergillus fumigatus]KAH2547733.1 hypothetical protein KXW12_005549 [Aspergillus fumigatus]KAH2583868.1 hypothetical protein KXV99_007246 [Aspergillus fumigatus]